MKVLLVFILSYLLGSVSFSYILGKMIKMQDIRDYGSKNAGATNMVRVFGAKLGVITLLLDLLKGAAAVLIASKFEIEYAQYIALAGVVVGHDFPFYLNFNAGKGVSSTVGGIIALDYKVGLAVVVLMFLIVVITKYVSLASILMFVGFFVWTLYIYKEINLAVIISLFISLLGIFRHWKNIQRLFKGEERKFYIFKNKRKA